MKQYDDQTVAAMRAALEEVCAHVPISATSARTIVASGILKRASKGDATFDDFRNAGRRAILDQFASVEAGRALFR
jgi:hypothetical protein